MRRREEVGGEGGVGRGEEEGGIGRSGEEARDGEG